jgi:hypothetical protein
MATMKVTVQRNDHLDQFPQIFQEESKKFMTLVVEKVAATAQPKVPVDFGIARGSLQLGAANTLTKVEQLSLTVTQGVIGSALDYFGVIEEGRRAGKKFPPILVLRAWVARKLGPSIETGLTSIGPRRRGQRRLSKAATRREAEGEGIGPRNTPYQMAINRAAYLIGRKIHLKGIAGKHPLRDASIEEAGFVTNVFIVDLPAAIAARL